MKKYIDAEKLIIEIKALKLRKGFLPLENTEITEAYMARGFQFACDDIVDLIQIHQQEQPKEICSKCIHHGKDDDYCYYPHGGMRSLINENGVYECTGFYEKEQEQSEADLEKEIDHYLYGENSVRKYDGVYVPGARMRDWKNPNVGENAIWK